MSRGVVGGAFEYVKILSWQTCALFGFGGAEDFDGIEICILCEIFAS